jgi:hypothetical protein
MSHPTPVPRVNADIQLRLGDAALERILRSLHPVDCQICGAPLGDRRSSLVVVQLGPVDAEALLAHTQCSPPGWRIDGLEWTDPAEAYGSWHAHVALVAVAKTPDGEAPDLMPAFVLNPGLESVHLHCSGGEWRPNLASVAAAWGLSADLSVEPVGAVAAEGVRLDVDGRRILLSAATEPGGAVWADTEDDGFWASVEVRGGLLLVVTYAVDPHGLTDADFSRIREPGEALAGWVRRRS